MDKVEIQSNGCWAQIVSIDKNGYGRIWNGKKVVLSHRLLYEMLFGKKKPQNLQNVIDNDPELKKIDQEIKDLIDSQTPILLRIKKNRPDHWKIMVQKGLVPADLK